MLTSKEAFCVRGAGRLRRERRVLNAVRRDVKTVGQYWRGAVAKKTVISPDEWPSLKGIRWDQAQEELR